MEIDRNDQAHLTHSRAVVRGCQFQQFVSFALSRSTLGRHEGSFHVKTMTTWFEGSQRELLIVPEGASFVSKSFISSTARMAGFKMIRVV